MPNELNYFYKNSFNIKPRVFNDTAYWLYWTTLRKVGRIGKFRFFCEGRKARQLNKEEYEKQNPSRIEPKLKEQTFHDQDQGGGAFQDRPLSSREETKAAQESRHGFTSRGPGKSL